ncbi:hypothetical protein ZHAS_00015864 [Anopheles sinensis]|uniref:Uncharacterized protein n=1 Tax=Anopheles sinensis TaxID=74873 RepID=A0A084WC47_ANOSI|nr:hypothetical protein ZHAS_00015864 [Anopheles sinensis]
MEAFTFASTSNLVRSARSILNSKRHTTDSITSILIGSGVLASARARPRSDRKINRRVSIPQSYIHPAGGLPARDA